MPNDEGLFSQAEVDKIVRERLNEMKAQRDTARDDAAELKKTAAALEKDAASLRARAERADATEAELAKAREDLAAREGRWGSEKALMKVLGEKYDDDVAEVLIRKHAAAEDAPAFGEWAAAQAAERAGLFGTLLGAPQADATPAPKPGAVPAPVAPSAPAVNGGAGGAPPAGPAVQRGGIASMSDAEWAALKAQMGYRN
jgi:hypothetical protein